MGTELVKVGFHGDTLEAVQDGQGKVWVSLRRCCENLGLALETQRRKLAGKPWSVAAEMSATGPDGKRYETTMIDLETLPGWLFSIDARKVKEQSREKLARYQREAARALADWFFGRKQSAPDYRAEIHEMFLGELRSALRGLAIEMKPALAERRWTIKERCEQLGWSTASPKQRAACRNLANRMLSRQGFPPAEPESASPAAELLYREAAVAIVDEAIIRVWDDAEKQAMTPLFEGE